MFPCQPQVTFCRVKGPAVSPGEPGLVAVATAVGLNDVKVQERCRGAQKRWTSALASAGTEQSSCALLSLDASEASGPARSPAGGRYSEISTSNSTFVDFIPGVKGV